MTNSCAERFRFIFRHPFVGTFPLLRCYKCMFAWKLSIKWFSRACFWKCFVENSSNISIAYLISVDYFKFWLTFKEMKDFKPYKDLQEWSFKSWNCSVFLIYITELKKKLNTFLSFSYKYKYAGHNINHPYLLPYTTGYTICSHLCYGNVVSCLKLENITMFHRIKTPNAFSMSSSKKTWASQI